MKKILMLFCLLVIGVFSSHLMAQKFSLLPYGNMDSWVVRHIQESRIIGGEVKTLYAIGPNKTINGQIPYHNLGGSPWASSNVMAKVVGVVKTNTSVFPDAHPGHAKCCRMQTRLISVKVFGLINITVLATGSIYLGEMREPITGTKNPDSYLSNGIPFDKKPKALQFDYKYVEGPGANRIRETGFGRRKNVPGKDCGVVVVLLQRRWEDSKGNIFAHRIGTMVELIHGTSGWINAHNEEIHYGDISSSSFFRPYMRLNEMPRYARNSKGKFVKIQEVGWGTVDERPNYLVLQFTSSNGGAYVGSPGSTLWVDNVGFID